MTDDDALTQARLWLCVGAKQVIATTLGLLGVSAPKRWPGSMRTKRRGWPRMPKGGAHQWRGVIEEYRARLPVSAGTPVVTLREGGTPLVRSEDLSAADRLRRCTSSSRIRFPRPRSRTGG